MNSSCNAAKYVFGLACLVGAAGCPGCSSEAGGAGDAAPVDLPARDVQSADLIPAGSWLASAGGPRFDRAYGVAADSAGNSYVIGYFEGQARFGSATFTASGFNDLFVSKLDPSGRFVWTATSDAGTSPGQFASVAVDSAGNCYIAGSFNRQATFGTYALSGHESNIFVGKLDPAGKFLWANKAGGWFLNAARSIAVDKDSNSYVTGYFNGPTSFGGHTLSTGSNNAMFVAKLDPAGRFLWAVSSSGITTAVAHDLALDRAGNSLVTGFFVGGVAFGSYNLYSRGMEEIFVVKLDSAGKFLWARSAGGPKLDMGRAIGVDGSGNSLVSGHFYDAAVFGSTSLSSWGEADLFVSKLSPAGKFLWSTSGGGYALEQVHDLALDSAGNSYVAGTFFVQAFFGEKRIDSMGQQDALLVKFDPGGRFLWGSGAGGTKADYAYGVALAPGKGQHRVVGYFKDKAYFGLHHPTSAGNADVFVWSF